MTAAKSDLRKYIDAAGELPPDTVLGNLCYFTIRDGTYDGPTIEKWFEELNLNPKFVPEPNNPFNAFRIATSSADGTSYSFSNGNTAEVLVRDLRDTKEIFSRQLTREIRDKRQQRLAYEKVGEAVFYRPVGLGGKIQYGTERVRFSLDTAVVSPEEKPLLERVLQKIDDDYQERRNYWDANKVRGMIREYIKYLNGLRLKDGVYFVHRNRTDELQRLAELTGRLVQRSGGRNSMTLVPWVDLENLRESLIESFQDEAVKELRDVAGNIAKLRSTRAKITPAAYAKIKGEYDQVMKKALEYTRTLKIDQDRTGAEAETVQEMLITLQKEMFA